MFSCSRFHSRSLACFNTKFPFHICQLRRCPVRFKNRRLTDDLRRAVPQDQRQAAKQRIDNRGSQLKHTSSTKHADTGFCRGYVALAVVGDKGALSKDLDTGLGTDRQANMVAFAVEALKLVKEYISTNASQGGKI